MDNFIDRSNLNLTQPCLDCVGQNHHGHGHGCGGCGGHRLCYHLHLSVEDEDQGDGVDDGQNGMWLLDPSLPY